MLTFRNWLHRRDVNTVTGQAWFEPPLSLGIFRLFFLLLAKKSLEAFKFGFLLSWKLELKVRQSVMVEGKTGEETALVAGMSTMIPEALQVSALGPSAHSTFHLVCSLLSNSLTKYLSLW